MTNIVLILEIYYKISKKKSSRMQIYNLRRVYDCTTPGFVFRKRKFDSLTLYTVFLRELFNIANDKDNDIDTLSYNSSQFSI